jgi:Pyridoxamine 5'-phosphate oxidase
MSRRSTRGSKKRGAKRRTGRERARTGGMPVGELDTRYSSDRATPTPWEKARRQLEAAKTYWLATVRPDGRPHVTTIAAVWLEDALHFTTGENERKAKNLGRNSQCAITTGCHVLRGLDVVLEGKAALVTETTTLRRLAKEYRRKYARLFRFEVRDGFMCHEATVDRVLAYRVSATKALGFGKGKAFSQTRWRF